MWTFCYWRRRTNKELCLLQHPLANDGLHVFWKEDVLGAKHQHRKSTQLHHSPTNHYICTYKFNIKKRRCSDNSYKMYFALGIDFSKFAFQKVTANSEYISPLKKFIIFTLWSLIPNCGSDMSAQVPATPYSNVYFFLLFYPHT